jgi:hypothetical protein
MMTIRNVISHIMTYNSLYRYIDMLLLTTTNKIYLVQQKLKSIFKMIKTKVNESYFKDESTIYYSGDTNQNFKLLQMMGIRAEYEITKNKK